MRSANPTHHRPPAAPRRPDVNIDLAGRFHAIRASTEALAAPLTAEDCALQSMPDASPVKWHLAHTSWFFETFVLAQHLHGYTPFDPAFRVLFNSYYNGVGDKHPRPERGLLSRPSLSDVLGYRTHVNAAMVRLFSGSLPTPVAALIELGLQHEQQHQELIVTDVKHLLSRNPLKPTYRSRWPLQQVKPQRMAWHSFAGGLVTIGHRGAGFAFDNEGPAHDVYIAPFELASRPVTHGEFAAFIEDGGYQRPDVWLSLGWEMVQARGWQAPLYWERRKHGWQTFTLHGMIDVDPHTPVCHVSFFEADAYARWAGTRLPTEFEWEFGVRDVALTGNFLESGALHPMPPLGDASSRLPFQMFGDVWEWTRSDYAPYPGFRPTEGAVGEYNGKFMCSQYVLRGGSCATPASHIRPTYRNFFPPDARWQFSGLRLARDCR
ncbi:MAG: ergothioneine biosynthesis protein EgtB [Betaproteobacteria bacterium]|nr:ergothioneine biosynthesis protein EgtB [Betaproteobacteria bacterium]